MRYFIAQKQEDRKDWYWVFNKNYAHECPAFKTVGYFDLDIQRLEAGYVKRFGFDTKAEAEEALKAFDLKQDISVKSYNEGSNYESYEYVNNIQYFDKAKMFILEVNTDKPRCFYTEQLRTKIRALLKELLPGNTVRSSWGDFTVLLPDVKLEISFCTNLMPGNLPNYIYRMGFYASIKGLSYPTLFTGRYIPEDYSAITEDVIKEKITTFVNDIRDAGILNFRLPKTIEKNY